MSVSVEKLEHNMAKLTIEVPVDEFDKAVEKAYHKNKNKMSVPGFRKGNAPLNMVKKAINPNEWEEDGVLYNEEKLILCYKMCSAILIGEKSYNFAELIEKDFFKLMQGTKYEWISNLILSSFIFIYFIIGI